MTNQVMTSQKLNENIADKTQEHIHLSQQKDKEKERRVHRVGGITLGLMLVAFGILFILHMILPQISYEFIFRLWPLILISMGIEVLIGNMKTGVEMKYDKGSVFLLIIMAFFAMCMAGMEVLFQIPWIQTYL